MAEESQAKLLFIGVGENAQGELAALRSKGVAVEAVISSPTKAAPVVGKNDLSTDAGIIGFAKSFGAVGSRLANLLLTVPVHARDEAAQLASIYSRVERGEFSLERVLISGHHYTGSTTFFAKTGDGRSLDFIVLNRLAEIFPKAVGAVKHLMLSGCNTLTDSGLRENPKDTFARMFPNFKTALGYIGKAPLFDPRSSTSGSMGDISSWLNATAGNPDALNRGSVRASPNAHLLERKEP